MFTNAAYITIYSVVLVNSSDDIHYSIVTCSRTMFFDESQYIYKMYLLLLLQLCNILVFYSSRNIKCYV